MPYFSFNTHRNRLAVNVVENDFSQQLAQIYKDSVLNQIWGKDWTVGLLSDVEAAVWSPLPPLDAPEAPAMSPAPMISPEPGISSSPNLIMKDPFPEISVWLPNNQAGCQRTNSNDYSAALAQIYEASGLGEIWGKNRTAELPKAEAAVWPPPPLQEVPKFPAPMISPDPENSSPPMIKKPVAATFPEIPVRIPRCSAKRQKKMNSDFEREAPVPSSRLHVSNVPFWFRDFHLIWMFQQCGNPKEAEIIFNERGSKGFGFVTFDNVDEATLVRQMYDGMELFGRVIEVNYASERTFRNIQPQRQQFQDLGFGFMPSVHSKSNGCKINRNAGNPKNKRNHLHQRQHEITKTNTKRSPRRGPNSAMNEHRNLNYEVFPDKPQPEPTEKYSDVFKRQPLSEIREPNRFSVFQSPNRSASRAQPPRAISLKEQDLEFTKTFRQPGDHNSKNSFAFNFNFSLFTQGIQKRNIR